MAEYRKADYDYQTTVTIDRPTFLNYLLQNPTVNGKKLKFT